MNNDVTFKSSFISRLAIPGESHSMNSSSRSSSPDIPIHTPPSESSVDHAPRRRPSTLSIRPQDGQPATSKHLVSADIGFTDEIDIECKDDQDFESGAKNDHIYKATENMAHPSSHLSTDVRSKVPLLAKEGDLRGRENIQSSSGGVEPPFVAHRSTFRSRSPDYNTTGTNKKKYIYAAFFLLLSLISFVVQTETAKYVTQTLHWEKSYCML